VGTRFPAPEMQRPLKQNRVYNQATGPELKTEPRGFRTQTNGVQTRTAVIVPRLYTGTGNREERRVCLLKVSVSRQSSPSRTRVRTPSPPRGGLRSLTAAGAAIGPIRAIPPKIISRITTMNISPDISFGATANVFGRTLSLEEVRQQAPAVFAEAAHQRLSSKYTMISTERVLAALLSAGFVLADARQTRTHRASALYVQHVVRLRRRFETIALRDSCPEILLRNSHDGSSGYLLQMALYRAVCSNGLVVSRGAFPAVCVAHRGRVVDEVVTGALQISERFDQLAAQVELMEARLMPKVEQMRFAERALALKYPDVAESGMVPAQLLTIRRPEDMGIDLYTVLNRAQENLLRGGLSRRGPSGRPTRTRRVTSIRRDVALNSRLWDLATEVLAA